MRYRARVLGVGLLLVAAGLALLHWWPPVDEPPAPEGAGHLVVSRVAVIDPGVHELLIRLEATEKMVGRPDYTDEFEQTRALPTLGTGLSPSYEQIVRTGPDLILTTHASRGVVLGNLQKIAPTEPLPWLTVDEVVESIRAIGELLDISGKANALAERMRLELAPQLGPDSPRVLVLLGAPSASDTDLWVVKPNSLHGAALAAAGGRHAIPTEIVGPPTLSIEGLLQVDPDIILVLLSDPDTTEEMIRAHGVFWARLQMLSAVRSGKVGYLVGRTHFYTGPGVMDFKDALRAKIAEVQTR